MRSSIFALVSLFLLAACDSTLSLQELRTAQPATDPYQAALAEGYKNYAEAKVANFDWWTSKYFADKGLMAAYGRETVPEDPASWEIPTTMLPEFTTARARLMTALEANKVTQPGLAAAAVVAYDRWVEVQYNGWDAGGIEERRDAFFAALGKLEQVQVAGADAPSSEPLAPGKKAVESTSTILYFPFDSDALGDTAKAALAQLVHDIKAAGNVSVSINGHADRAGTEHYNLDLSERRAKFVQRALKEAGVPVGMMKYFAFGESDPAVPTADGIEEPRNRRVEIFIE